MSKKLLVLLALCMSGMGCNMSPVMITDLVELNQDGVCSPNNARLSALVVDDADPFPTVCPLFRNFAETDSIDIQERIFVLHGIIVQVDDTEPFRLNATASVDPNGGSSSPPIVLPPTRFAEGEQYLVTIRGFGVMGGSDMETEPLQFPVFGI